MFPIFAGLHFWMPKITGRMYHRRRAVVAFWMTFVGMNLTFFVQHFLGLAGMPRRVYTYGSGLGWDGMNLLSSVGAFVLASGFLLALGNLVVSRFRGPEAGSNPWDAETLEWAIPSPPPDYNFAAFPVVASVNPMWDREPDEDIAQVRMVGDEDVIEPRHAHHRTLTTAVLDANRLEMSTMPGPSIWPLVVALCGLAFSLSFIVRSWLLAVVTGIVVTAALISWHAGVQRQEEE